LNIARSEGYEPNATLVAEADDRETLTRSPVEAAARAQLRITDSCAPMGHESEAKARLERFSGFQVNHQLISYAADDALFMHCLPTHRNEEVSKELLENESTSVVWDEAENRLHT
jgi:ornithine carbamoyltransferase